MVQPLSAKALISFSPEANTSEVCVFVRSLNDKIHFLPLGPLVKSAAVVATNASTSSLNQIVSDARMMSYSKLFTTSSSPSLGFFEGSLSSMSRDSLQSRGQPAADPPLLPTSWARGHAFFDESTTPSSTLIPFATVCRCNRSTFSHTEPSTTGAISVHRLCAPSRAAYRPTMPVPDPSSNTLFPFSVEATLSFRKYFISTQQPSHTRNPVIAATEYDSSKKYGSTSSNSIGFLLVRVYLSSSTTRGTAT
mmetsp:Transcript_14967/g.37933  ORF Transcript_14967/g.37933 Transcript_14967/m.37933 type:complete len:250 (-) Transcript_14967:122-871(-)